MAIYFIDLVNGDDTQNGLSFAARVQTVARIAPLVVPGDTVRIMQSAAPVDASMTGSWTSKSAIVNTSSQITKSLFNGTWLPGSITPLVDNSTYKYQTSSIQLTLSPSLVTGKLAYVQFSGALNFSPYGQVSFWIKNNIVIPANTLSLRVCSDNGGNTTMVTVPIPAINSTGQWVPITVNTGALPGSAGSLAVYLDGAGLKLAINIDNIVACLAPGVGCVTHQTLIGKPNSTDVPNGAGTETWFAVAALTDTSAIIDNDPNAPVANRRGYYGSTEVVELWTREPILTAPATSSLAVINDITVSGNNTTLINWQFGMDPSGMNTQTGTTWLSGQSGWGVGLKIEGDFNAINGIGTVRYWYGIWLHASHCGQHNFTGAAHCTAANIFLDGTSTSNAIVSQFVNNGGASGYIDRVNGGGNNLQLKNMFSNVNYGAELAANDLSHDGVANFNGKAAFLTTGAVRIYRYTTHDNGSDLNGNPVSQQGLQGSYYIGNNFDTFVLSRIDANFNYQWDEGVSPAPGIPNGGLNQWSARWTGFITAPTTDIYTITVNHDDGVRIYFGGQAELIQWSNWLNNVPQSFTYQFTGGVAVPLIVEYDNNLGPGTLKIYWQCSSIAKTIIPPSAFSYGTTVQVGLSVQMDPITSAAYEVNLHSCVIGESTPFGGFQNYINNRIRSHNHQGQHGNHIMQTDGGIVVNETGPDRHTQSGFAWKIQPSSPRSNLYPLDYRLASIAALPNLPVTITCWFKRSDANVSAFLFIPGGQIDGVPLDVSSPSTLNGTYEQLSVTCTPSDQGVIDVYARVYGGTNSSVWVDDMGVKQ